MPEEYPIREVLLNDYPPTLQNMHRPPAKLHLRGRLPDSPDQKYLCVVGSRRWTPYGRDAVNKIVSGLKGYPISIVSGLAFGIDSLAHRVALEAGLHCVAFPGSSLEWEAIYPVEHHNLAKEIVENGGTLISPWQTGYATGKWAFPARNRLMAGLSHAVLVVEAGVRSGSLMTAKHAEEYDRDVLTIPGSIFSDLSYGPHMLIKRGAIPVTSAEDVLEALGFTPALKGKISNHKLENLEPTIKKLVELLSYGESTIDSLADKTGMPVMAVNEKLSYLELEGLVRVEDGLAHLI